MIIKEISGDPWLMTEEAFALYQPCMHRPAFEAYRREMGAGDPERHAFVCIEDGRRIGLITLEKRDRDTAEIRGIAVQEECRRRGAGTLLVRAAALKLGADTITAETDTDAVRFYERSGFRVKRFARHYPDGDAVRYECVLDMNALPGLEIRPTGSADLESVRSLWADGEVMKFVGFPEGIRKSPGDMAVWLARIDSERPLTDHFSVYFRGVFCGESFYGIDEKNGVAALDIKLFGFARGRGIAKRALCHAIDRAFMNGAVKCYVDPNPENKAALALYSRVGMVQKQMPEELRNEEYPGFLYFEISRQMWRRMKNE